jgi:hypothetical protein
MEPVALIDQVPKAGRMDATQKHPRWSGGFGGVAGSRLGRAASASLPGAQNC